MKFEIETPDAAEAKTAAHKKLGPRAHISTVVRCGKNRERVIWVYTTDWQEL